MEISIAPPHDSFSWTHFTYASFDLPLKQGISGIDKQGIIGVQKSCLRKRLKDICCSLLILSDRVSQLQLSIEWFQSCNIFSVQQNPRNKF